MATPVVPVALAEDRVIAILRGYSAGAAFRTVEALQHGGIRCVEVTLNRPDSLETIGALRHTFGETMLVGAGTVTDLLAAKNALDAGAQLVLSPNTDADVIAEVTNRGIPCFPGAMTPSEVVRAWAAHATAVKLFPAAVLGPRYVRDLRGPLADVPLLAVGGVDGTNAQAFVDAGCFAVGIGSWLVGNSPEVNDLAGIQERARAALEVVRTR